MSVQTYLRQYNRDEDAVLHWVRQNQHDLVVASLVLQSWAVQNKYFASGTELDHTLLKECHEDHKKSISEVLAKHKKYNYSPSLWSRIKDKWRSIQKPSCR